MIFGGTALQTFILTIVTTRCDWEKEVYIYLYLKVENSHSKLFVLSMAFLHVVIFCFDCILQANKARLSVSKWSRSNSNGALQISN